MQTAHCLLSSARLVGKSLHYLLSSLSLEENLFLTSFVTTAVISRSRGQPYTSLAYDSGE